MSNDIVKLLGKLDSFNAITTQSTEQVGQVNEGWDDMMKSVKEKNGPQASGGEGKKAGKAYGGSKQVDSSDDDSAEDKKDKKDKKSEKKSDYDASELTKAWGGKKKTDESFASAIDRLIAEEFSDDKDLEEMSDDEQDEANQKALDNAEDGQLDESDDKEDSKENKSEKKGSYEDEVTKAHSKDEKVGDSDSEEDTEALDEEVDHPIEVNAEILNWIKKQPGATVGKLKDKDWMLSKVREYHRQPKVLDKVRQDAKTAGRLDESMDDLRRLAGMKTLTESWKKVDEVTPPGGEKVVKALKKNPNVDNPWAVAWSMKNKGQIEEDDMEEGNEFSGALAKAKASGASEFEVDGKKYKVKESDEKETCNECGEVMEEGHDCSSHDEDQLNECGEMSAMGSQPTAQDSNMNVTTNVNSDGNKNVTITASGAAADDLMIMLKNAGLENEAGMPTTNSPTLAVVGAEVDPETQDVDQGFGDEATFAIADEEVEEASFNLKGQPNPSMNTGNDMHRPKKSFKATAGGDNPMNVKENAFAGRFMREYESIKLRK